MFADERYNEIIKLIEAKGSVTATELTRRFGVSAETIRRDLAHLEERGTLKRVYGGAVRIPQSRGLGKLEHRLYENNEQKRALSETAARYISDGDCIALDSGSTAYEFAKVLKERFDNLTIVTYSLDIIELLSDKTGFELICPGGKYLGGERVFGGIFTEEALLCQHVSKSFVFPSSVSEKYGVTISLDEFYPLERTLMKICDTLVILADSTKFETVSRFRLCGLDEVDLLITDASLSDEVYHAYLDAGVNILK